MFSFFLACTLSFSFNQHLVYSKYNLNMQRIEILLLFKYDKDWQLEELPIYIATEFCANRQKVKISW